GGVKGGETGNMTQEFTFAAATFLFSFPFFLIIDTKKKQQNDSLIFWNSTCFLPPILNGVYLH
ncbi:hypothetical protein ACJX0J_007919, partial [Zea mays]